MNLSEPGRLGQLCSCSGRQTHHQQNELRKEGVSSISTEKYNQEADYKHACSE